MFFFGQILDVVEQSDIRHRLGGSGRVAVSGFVKLSPGMSPAGDFHDAGLEGNNDGQECVDQKKRAVHAGWAMLDGRGSSNRWITGAWRGQRDIHRRAASHHRRINRRRIAWRRDVDPVVSAKGVGLKIDLAVFSPVADELHRPVAASAGRVIKHDVGMLLVAQVIPEPSRARLFPILVQHVHRRVVGVDHLRLQHLDLHQVIQGAKRRGASGHPIAHRRAG